jgi:hypothetical protein
MKRTLPKDMQALLPVEPLANAMHLRREIVQLKEWLVVATVIAVCGWFCFGLAIVLKP